METIKISLVDNDFVVHAAAELSKPCGRNDLIRMLDRLGEDFIPGENAFLDVEGPGKEHTRFAISRVED